MEGTSKKGTLWDTGLSMEERLDWLIGELTMDEKLHMLSSGSAGVERLGVPTCYLGGEAAHGVEAEMIKMALERLILRPPFRSPSA